MKGCCSLPEVELVWVAALDLGGNVPARVFLRCTELTLPEKPNETDMVERKNPA